MRKFLMLITVLFLVFFIYSCTGSGEVAISFEENGGTEVEDMTVSTSSTSINLPEPTKEGFIFDGWYLDDALTQPFTIASLLTNTSLTLYAKWTSSVVQYTITFESNGGSAVAAITQDLGSAVTAPANPTKSGFTFAGWFSDAALSSAYTFSNMPANNTTLYAKWEPVAVITKTISFESNGGSVVAAITQEVGSALTAPTAPTKVGSTFNGWFSDVALTSAYTFTTMPADNITLYAKWTVNNYTISFEENGGSEILDITQAYNTTVTAPAAPTKVGSTFNGWYSDVALTTAYTFTTMPANNITLYAKWTVNNYTISFEENGGSTVLDITQAYNSTVISPAAPTKVGSTFNGWYSDIALTMAYTFTTMPASNTTLYAKWTVNNYTITYNSNGGSAVSNTVALYLSSITAPAAPTKTGHSFDGWYSDVALLTPYVFSTMPANDFTLYAKWTLNAYTITFEENGGSAVADITQNYLTTVTQPAIPTKEGFDFVSWYTNIELTSIYTFTTMPAENITLYARWVYKEYSINYVDGSNVIPPTMIRAYNPIVLMSDPVRPGYTFDGWYADNLLISLFTLTVMPEQNITVYAKWSPVNFTITYESNGGSLVTAVSVPYQEVIPAHGVPTKEGYIFDGWYQDIDLSILFTVEIMPLGNFTLYAKWIVDDGYDRISDILQYSIPHVKVKGVIYYKFPNPMDPGFYLYDGTGYIFVMASSTGLDIGDGIELEGDFNYFEYVPQIVNVTNLQENTSFTTLPVSTPMTLTELLSDSYNNPYIYSKPIITSGIVQFNMGKYFLAEAGSENTVAINYKSVDPMNDVFAARIGQKITMHAIVLGYEPMNSIWHIIYDPSSPIEDIVLTDQQKVDELIAFGIAQLDQKEFYSSFMLQLPTNDPIYGATIDFITTGENASYFNPSTGLFLETDVQKNITLQITVTLGDITEVVEVTIILLPIEILTIEEFLALNDMDYALVSGIVIFSFEEANLLIIADESGSILVVQSDMFAKYGDLIVVHGYHASMEGIVLMSGSEETVIDVLDEGLPNPITPVQLTVDQFNALDVFNSLYWAKYLEVSGELVVDEMSHSVELFDGESSMPILIFSHELYEMFMQLNGMNVIIRGFSLPNFDDEPFLMFIFTGQPEDLILDYTDQELADMLALMLQGYLENLTFFPGQIVDLPFEHPWIQLTLSYTVALDDEHLFDINTFTIDSMIDEELWISIFATITIGDASAISDIELHVTPLTYLSVADFMLLTDQDMHFVKGVVLLITGDNMIIIADETGVLISISANPDVQVGDLVILYGAKMETPDGMIILGNEPSQTVQGILASGQDHPLTPTQISIYDFSQLDLADPQYYLKYYQLEGLLSHDPMSEVFFITDGTNHVPIFPTVPEAVIALNFYIGQEIKISGLSLVITDGGGIMVLAFINYPGDLSIRFTDEELALHVAGLLTDHYGSKILRPGATHLLPETYSPYTVTISYEIIGPNASLYNLATGLISDTITEQVLIGVRATITAGIEVEIVEFDLIVEPIETQTIAEFYAGDFDELYMIRGIVVVTQMFDGPIIIADETGHMFVVKPLNVEIGDEVIIQGYKRSHEGITLIWDEETTLLLEVLSKDIPNPMTLQTMTIDEFNLIDMTDQSNWGIYVEVTGFVSMLEDSFFPLLTEMIDGGDFIVFAPMYLFESGGSSIQMILDPFEEIYPYIGFQVKIRGFLFPTFDDEDPYAPDRLLLVSTEGSIQLTYETDQEKIDAAIAFGTYMLENEIFRPGDTLYLPDSIPLLGITMTWEFVGVNGYAIDLLTMTLQDVIDHEILEFEVTITCGELTVVHVFAFNLYPYPLITIEDFYGLQDGEFGKIQVIVREKIEYFGIILEEPGNSLYLYGLGFDDLNVGDEVILFGKKAHDGLVKISGYDDSAYYQYLGNVAVDAPIETITPLQELATSEIESLNLLRYHVVQGRLIYNSKDMNYYLTDGLNTIMLFTQTEAVYLELEDYIDMDVEIKFFNYEFYYTMYGPGWTGYVIAGVDIVTEIVLTDGQILEIVMNYMKNEMNRIYKDDMSYQFSVTHPLYGGSYSFEIDVMDLSLASIALNEITFQPFIEDTYVTIHITASYNSSDLIDSYELYVMPYTDPMSSYNPGPLGMMYYIDDFVTPGTFAGLRIVEVDRHHGWFGGSDMIVDLEFPYAHDIGVSYYTLQYYDTIGEAWMDFLIEGSPLTTPWNNFSLTLSEGMTFRLMADTGIVSNEVSFAATMIETYFTGYYLEMGMYLTGVMYPFIGHGLNLEDISIYNLDGDLITTGYSLQWYRVNPFTYEEFIIAGATNQSYTTTIGDVGYLMMIKVTGDEVNVGGMMKIYVDDTVKLLNIGYVTNETTSGFSIGFDYIIDINDLYDLVVYDSKGNFIEVLSVTATSDPAVFDIELNLIGVDAIHINLMTNTYMIGEMGEFYNSIGIYAYLLE